MFRSLANLATRLPVTRSLVRFNSTEETFGSFVPAAPSNYMFIANLPYDIKWFNVKDLLEEHGVPGSFIKLVQKDGVFKGTCIVCYEDIPAAEKAIATIDRQMLNGRPLFARFNRSPSFKNRAPVLIHNIPNMDWRDFRDTIAQFYPGKIFSKYNEETQKWEIQVGSPDEVRAFIAAVEGQLVDDVPISVSISV